MSATTFIRARKAGCPLIAIETPDPAATRLGCLKQLNGKAEEAPILLWDAINGMQAMNEQGKEYVAAIPEEIKLQLSNPAEALRYIGQDTPKKTILFFSNAHLCLEQGKEPNLSVIQAAWNLRDTFKNKGASLVMTAPSVKLPAELSQDCIVLTEEPPSAEQITKIIESLTADAGIEPALIDKPKATDALLGYLSAFGVEQAFSIGLSKQGADLATLWNLKVQNLKQCAGLEVSLPQNGFESMAGNEGVKSILRRHLSGREKPRAILWLDEIEKMLAGGSTDLSGTTQAILEQFLNWTAQSRAKGFLLAGIPGAGKSLTCQTTAAEAKCPLLRASLSTVKGGLVGQSESNMRALLKSVDAVAQGRVLMLATCNSLDTLSPEVMARFNLGAFFYDYPTQDEAGTTWAYYMKKYELSGTPPNKTNWVGREIESCCERAWLWNIPLEEAASTVVPVCTANAGKMDILRRSVNGRFLSAARPGIYNMSASAEQGERATRKLELP
jgi:hypothetical protein